MIRSVVHRAHQKCHTRIPQQQVQWSNNANRRTASWKNRANDTTDAGHDRRPRSILTVLRVKPPISHHHKYTTTTSANNFIPFFSTAQYVTSTTNRKRYSTTTRWQYGPSVRPLPPQCRYYTASIQDENIHEIIAQIPIEDVRNFCFIAHVDHGKSSLSSRILELTGNLGRSEQLNALQYINNTAAASSTITEADTSQNSMASSTTTETETRNGDDSTVTTTNNTTKISNAISCL